MAIDMILDDVKTLVGIDAADLSKDPTLTIFKNRAITFVGNYLNNSIFDAVYIEANFADALVELVYNAYALKGKGNIQSESQGSRSVTYKEFEITQDVKALLPLPSIRMR